MHAFIQHCPGWTSSVIADAVQIQHLRQSGSPLSRRGQIDREPQWVQTAVVVVVRKIRQNLAAVGRLPPEQFQRQLIGIIPSQFLCDEIINSRFLIDLRQLPVVAKGIRIPADSHIRSIFFLKPALSQQQRTHQRFAVGQVQIGLDPHASDRFPASLLNPPLDLLIDRRILLRHPIVVNSRRLGKGIRVFIHELQGGAECPPDGVDRFRPWPQPRGIDVGIAGFMEGHLPQQWPQQNQLAARLLPALGDAVRVLGVDLLVGLQPDAGHLKVVALDGVVERFRPGRLRQ